jgi:glycosyltransferase involved in cell wall biosynthesis
MLVLLEALDRLSAESFPFTCQIAGGGPLHDTLERFLVRRGLKDRVTLCGPLPQEEIREKLRWADLFVLACVVAASGDRDGIPVSLMESMATGVPVVSTEVTGVPELITSPDDGLLVPPHDPTALAEAIKQLLSDPTRRRSVAGAARQKIAREFTLSSTSRQLYARIEQVSHTLGAHTSDSVQGAQEGVDDQNRWKMVNPGIEAYEPH